MMREKKIPAPKIPLDHLAPGEHGCVSELKGGRGFVQRLTSMGLLPGTDIEMLKKDSHGPMIVRIRETRVALGCGMAHRVWVMTAK